MYKTYYNMKTDPFQKSIKKENLYKSDTLLEFNSRMEYMKQNKGIILITGEAGTGKTTALRAFAEDLKPEFYRTFYIAHTTVTTFDFYLQLNKTLGGDYSKNKSDLFKSIQNLILEYVTIKKQIPVIIFDEIHLLKSENFHELQILLNFNLDSLDPAIIVFCGHSLLEKKFNSAYFAPINQRLRLKYRFPYLNKKETQEYIAHHLNLSGCKESLFNENSIDAIFNRSNGAVRVINNIAVKALMYGASNRQDIITEETIFKITQEL